MFGVLAINKPAAVTSRTVVNQIQRLVRPSKVGHTGTLDPMATGVLLVAVGGATRLVEFSHQLTKCYIADFQLGLTSDTLDTDGDVRPVSDARVPNRREIVEELDKWIGRVMQVPPKYSAIHVRGQRAYDLARSGQQFQLPARPVEIYALDVLAYEHPQLRIQIRCGSGTYVRSIGSDVTRGLGTDAVMSRLVRTRVGPFPIDDCVDLDRLTDKTVISAHLHPAQTMLLGMPRTVLSAEQAIRIRNGLPLQLPDEGDQTLAAVDENDALVAVLTRTDDRSYRSLRVFQNANETNQPNRTSMPQSPES